MQFRDFTSANIYFGKLAINAVSKNIIHNCWIGGNDTSCD